MLGGSGGGGGRGPPLSHWFPGNGGGGGGFIYLFTPRYISIAAPSGLIIATGGIGGEVPQSPPNFEGCAGGGGGGGGGTVVLDGESVSIEGHIDVNGANGGIGRWEYADEGESDGGHANPPDVDLSINGECGHPDGGDYIGGGGGGGVGQIFVRTCPGLLTWFDQPDWLCELER
jgi:hypothetical protein